MDPKTKFELGYWRQASGHDVRYRRILSLDYWGLLCVVGSILEVGTGPFGGVLPYVVAYRKVGLDPLYPEYQAASLLQKWPEIEYVSECIERFETPDRFDAVVSMNALDHGNSDFGSVDRIAALLKPGGRFYLHVHLRRLDQLNVGHDHPLCEKDLDAAIERTGLREVSRVVHDTDPIEGCAYKTLIAVWQKCST